MSVSGVFLLLITFSFGQLWARVLPRREWVAGTRFERLGRYVHFVNPGPFGLKEVILSLTVIHTSITHKYVYSLARRCLSCCIYRCERELGREQLCSAKGESQS